MRKLILITAIILTGVMKTQAQADLVVGIWLTEKKNSQVEIYKTADGKYEGKLVWLKEPNDENGRPKTDKDNPDRTLRSRPLKGLLLLKDFTYNASSKEWTGGTIYDPESGRTYDAYMWFDSNYNLNIKGFVMGMRFLGRSTAWTRENQLRR